MTALVLEFKPSDAGYQTLYDQWVADGKGRTLDQRFTEKTYQALFPNGGTQPTFVLTASLPGATSLDLTAPLSGVEMAWMAWQRTWHGNRLLPKQ